LISSTGAPHTIIEPEHIKEVMQRRPQDPLVILDIAMPRDVVPSVSQLENVHVFDLDNLQHQLQASLDKRHGEIPSVQTILEEELESFRGWYSSLGIRPLIAEMHQRAEAIRLEEMDRTIEALGSLDPEDKEKINAMTRALVKKLLHAPITRLKQQSKQGSAAAYALVTRDLFDLGDGELDPFFPHRRKLQ
jgi:glutamyl-tRNA reductase